MADDLINFLCCLGAAQQVGEAVAQDPKPTGEKLGREPIATPVFGGELPMLALSMDRERVVEDAQNIACSERL